MKINEIKIINYKIYENLELKIENTNNILVGDNGAGKTTILEAIFMTLTGRINNSFVEKSITPDLFSYGTRKKYKENVHSKNIEKLPKILIEIYFDDEDQLAKYKGQVNSSNINSPGLFLSIEFDSKFATDYKERLQVTDTQNDLFIRDIPTEYYHVQRRYFNGDWVIQRTNPFKVTFIDGTKRNYANFIEKYIHSSVKNNLSIEQLSELRSIYNGHKQKLKSNKILKQFNNYSDDNTNTDMNSLTLTVKESLPEEWIEELTLSVNGFPFSNIGLGLQRIIETKLAMKNDTEDNNRILLFEEPENNLSYSSMSKLISLIEKENKTQNFITTHSSFVANKLGLNDLLLCEKGKISFFTQIEKSDFNYFKKLPGYDTLRLLLSKRIILVEGPTDELIFNRAYQDVTGNIPISDGIDVFVVDSLAFKRYINLGNTIGKEIIVITDNDGDNEKFNKKYSKYFKNPKIKFFYEKNFSFNTLEPSIVAANSKNNTQLDNLLQTIDINHKVHKNENGSINKDNLITFMTKHKSEWALRVFDSDRAILYPANIMEAINYVKS